MSTAWRIRCIVLIAVVAMTLLACVEYVYGTVAGNLKFELTPEGRAVVSCVDGSSPVVDVISRPDPKNGVYIVLSCEKGNK